jgi:hypothetical protein
MRRLTLLALALTIVGGTGCKRSKRVKASGEMVEQESALRSVVQVADPRIAMQLLQGFHDVEGNAWRWTASRFSATLKPPPGSAEKGATLFLAFALPDPVVERVKKITLTANINGTSIPGETFNQPGNHTFKKDIPASALNKDAIQVDFAVDNYLKAGEVERRELAIIVTSLGLESK